MKDMIIKLLLASLDTNKDGKLDSKDLIDLLIKILNEFKLKV